MKRIVTPILLMFVAIGVSHAQEVKLSGEIRERSEFSGKSTIIRQSPDVFHLLRSRLRADVTVSDDMSAVFEVQDARMFGTEFSTLNSGAPAFDLRQGYFVGGNILGMPLSVIVGRQLLSYGNQRLLGAIDWSNLGQSFDGAVLRGKFNEVTLDLLGTALVRNPNPTGGYKRDVFLTGLWGTWKPASILQAGHVFYLYDNPYMNSSSLTVVQQQRHTAGLDAKGSIDAFDFELDGAYQFGDIKYSNAPDTSVSIGANLVGVRAGYTLKDLANLRIGVGFDRLSGSDLTAKDKYGAFNTLYGTNHKFYGAMDYFTNFNSQHLGLQDIFGQLSIAWLEKWRLAVDVHLFSTVTDPEATIPGTQTAYSKNIGKEIDITLWYSHKGGVDVSGGISIFDGDPDRYLLQGRKTMNWAWIMTSARF